MTNKNVILNCDCSAFGHKLKSPGNNHIWKQREIIINKQLTPFIWPKIYIHSFLLFSDSLMRSIASDLNKYSDVVQANKPSAETSLHR